jgi:hypothetical protein
VQKSALDIDVSLDCRLIGLSFRPIAIAISMTEVSKQCEAKLYELDLLTAMNDLILSSNSLLGL